LRVTLPDGGFSAAKNHLQLEPGNSSRMAMYNTELKTFRILDLDTATVVVNIDFGALDRMPGVPDNIQGLSLHAGSWSSGHFVFLKNLRQPHNGRDSFQGQGWQMSDFKKKEWASFFLAKSVFLVHCRFTQNGIFK
jgi:hypothetical protein